MIIGVLKEPSPETRVSILPEHVVILKKWKVDVIVESNAGASAFANDEKYEQSGAKIEDREEVLKSSDLILSINAPAQPEISLLHARVLLGIYQPLFNI